MKTRGLVVVSGYVAAESNAAAGSWEGIVPIQFWNRLKSAIQRLGLVDEFKRDRGDQAQWHGSVSAYGREQRLFARWVRRCGLTVQPGHFEGQELWPWTRGWTEELVDSYLSAFAAKAEAA